MNCYMCNAPTSDTSGLCADCRRASWQDHARNYYGDVPASNVERWDHKDNEFWYWSTDGLWKLSDRDPRVLPDFLSFDYGGNHAADPAPAPKSADELGRDLAVIIAAQIEEITHLTVENRRLQADLLAARVATRLRHWN